MREGGERGVERRRGGDGFRSGETRGVSGTKDEREGEVALNLPVIDWWLISTPFILFSTIYRSVRVSLEPIPLRRILREKETRPFPRAALALHLLDVSPP